MQMHTSITRQMALTRQDEARSTAARARLAREARRARRSAPEPARRRAPACGCPETVAA
jgi:hypothetical protein